MRAGLCVAVALASAVGVASCSSWGGSRLDVVGGEVPLSEHPARTSAVGVFDAFGRPFCSGVLVAPGLVVTAGHCVEKMASAAEARLVFGETFENSVKITPVEKRSLRIFRQVAPNLDVGWFRFEGEVPPGFAPVPLLGMADELAPGTNVEVAGYGLTSPGCQGSGCAGTLRKVSTRIEAHHDDARLHHLLTVGPLPGVGACRGDSGGPLYARVGGEWHLAGIVTGNWIGLVPELADTAVDACAHGHFVATFVGGHGRWIEESSGKPLRFLSKAAASETWERPAPGSTFEAWCAYGDAQTEAWYTTQKLLDMASTRFEPQEWPRRYSDCKAAAETLGALTEFTHQGVRFELGGTGMSQLRDLAPLASLRALERVKLVRESLDDVAPLGGLPRLVSLSIDDNTERGEVKERTLSVADVERMPVLEEIALRRLSKLVGLDAAVRNPSLRRVAVNLAGLRDTAAFSGAASVVELDLSNNDLRDVSGLLGLRSLRKLNLSGNSLRDVSALSVLTGLEEIDLRGNRLADGTCPVPTARCLF